MPPQEHIRPKPVDHEAIYADLETLIRRSPATGVLIPSRFGQIFGENGEAFDPERCPPIETVWVQTYKGRERRLIDGHHRARGIYKHYWQLVEKFGRDKPLYREFDATESSLNNVKIVPAEQRTPGQDALTQTQFLRASLDPLRQHTENATQRAATLLMGLWADVVEPDPRFPSLFALTTLRDVPDYQSRKDELFQDVSSDKRDALTQGLVTMQTTVREVHANVDEAVRDALAYVVIDPEESQSQREKNQQLAGMLHALSFVDEGHRPEIASISATKLDETFQRLIETHPHSAATEFFGVYRALANPTLTQKDLDLILKTRSPSTRLTKLLKEKELSERRRAQAAGSRTTEPRSNARVLVFSRDEEVDKRWQELLTAYATSIGKAPHLLTDAERRVFQFLARQGLDRPPKTRGERLGTLVEDLLRLSPDHLNDATVRRHINTIATTVVRLLDRHPNPEK